MPTKQNKDGKWKLKLFLTLCILLVFVSGCDKRICVDRDNTYIWNCIDCPSDYCLDITTNENNPPYENCNLIKTIEGDCNLYEGQRYECQHLSEEIIQLDEIDDFDKSKCGYSLDIEKRCNEIECRDVYVCEWCDSLIVVD